MPLIMMPMNKAFDHTNEEFAGYSKRLFKVMMITSVFFLLDECSRTGYLLWSSILIQNGNLTLGQLVAFNDYLFHAMFSIMLFCTVFMMYPRAAVSANRIEGSIKYRALDS